MSNNKSINQPKESVQELTPAIKMNIEQSHAILGRSSKEIMRQMAAALGIGITRGHSRLASPVQLQKQNRNTSIAKMKEPMQTNS
jgi:hypothetical protein